MDAKLLLLLVVAVGVSGHDDYQCPLGFEPTHCSSRKCKCMKNINDHLKCDEENQQLYLKIGYCISTYSDSDMTVVIGDCPYIHPSARNSSMFPYFPLPPNMTASEVNGYMCGEMNRTGRLCGRCENGTGPSVFSPDLKCVSCLDSSYGWALYLAAEFIPVTLFVLLVILLKIRLCADYANALVFFCNTLSAAFSHIRPDSFVFFHFSFEGSVASILASIYSIINLQFFQNFLPPICISNEMTNLEAIALRYVVALYPLLLILLIYVLVWLYDRNFKPVVLVWRPFSVLLTCFSETFDIKQSLIHAFASFFLLSYFSFAVTSTSLLTYTITQPMNADTRSSGMDVFYFDGSVQFSLDNALVPLACVFISVLYFLPIVLMLVYPTRTFQKCLNCCGLRCLPLHIFMDAFQGYYKNGTEGTRDYRYFAGIYLLFRFLAIFNFLRSLLASHYSNVVFLVSFSLSFALCRPYKNSLFNVVDCLCFGIIALGIFLFLQSLTASVAQRTVLLLLMSTPLLYLATLFVACYLLPKCSCISTVSLKKKVFL